MEVIDISKNISLFGADKVRVGLGGVGGGVVDYTGGYTGHRQHQTFNWFPQVSSSPAALTRWWVMLITN